MSQTLEQTTNQLLPVNNIFWIPINRISFLDCLNCPPARGYQETYTLIEADSEIRAVLSSRLYPGYFDNWKNLTQEERQNIQPFELRKGKIHQVLHCSQRFKNKQGDYTCGIPLYLIQDHEDKDDENFNQNGEFGMCCLEGYDTPYECPYKGKQIVPTDF